MIYLIKMKKFQKKFLKGITLIEMLIVLVLLAMLALGSFLVVSTHLKKARDAKRKADLYQIKNAIYDYYLDSNCFPQSLPSCWQDFKADGMTYYPNFPCDPKGKPYGYQTDSSACSQWFKVLTNLENTKDQGINKVGCRSGCGPNCEYNYGLSSSNILVNQGCVKYYACTPSGPCAEFIDPVASRCPKVFENDPNCGGISTCQGRKNRCHDERGKKN